MHIDPMSHVAARLEHAMTMLAELVIPSADPNLSRPVQIACLEDWITNYRLLIEFLVMHPPTNCASAKSFIPKWTPAETLWTRRLREDYGWASEHVSHIGQLKPGALTENVTPQILRIKATFLLDVIEEFVDELVVRDDPHAPMIRAGLLNARATLVGVLREE